MICAVIYNVCKQCPIQYLRQCWFLLLLFIYVINMHLFHWEEEIPMTFKNTYCLGKFKRSETVLETNSFSLSHDVLIAKRVTWTVVFSYTSPKFCLFFFFLVTSMLVFFTVLESWSLPASVLMQGEIERNCEPDVVIIGNARKAAPHKMNYHKYWKSFDT